MSFPLPDSTLTAGDLSALRSDKALEMRSKAAENAARSGDRQSLRRTAEEFEAQFLSQMLSHMFEGMSPNGLMGGGHAESIWRDFYVEEVSKGIARQGRLGIADMIERQLLKLQEVA